MTVGRLAGSQKPPCPHRCMRWKRTVGWCFAKYAAVLGASTYASSKPTMTMARLPSVLGSSRSAFGNIRERSIAQAMASAKASAKASRSSAQGSNVYTGPRVPPCARTHGSTPRTTSCS